jgi:hypothetical protein
VKRSGNNNTISFKIIEHQFIKRSQWDDEWRNQIQIQSWTPEVTNKKNPAIFPAKVVITHKLNKSINYEIIKLFKLTKYFKQSKSKYR